MARRLLLPVFPIAGGQPCDHDADVIGPGDFGACNSGDYTFSTGDVAIGTSTVGAAGERLTVQGPSASNVAVGLYAGDGDGTDHVNFVVYAVGTPGSIANRERLIVGWNTTDSRFQVKSEAEGNGTLRPLDIHTEGNDNQIHLATDGNVGIGTDTPDNKFSIQGDSGANVVASLYSGDGDGTDHVNFLVYGFGTPGSIMNRERLIVGWNTTNSEYQTQSEANGTGTLRPINIYTEGNTEQLFLGTNGNVGIKNSLVLGGGTTTIQSTQAGGPELISFQHSTFNHVAFACFVGSESNFRFGASMHGFMEWGPGNADQDVAFFRNWAGGLAV